MELVEEIRQAMRKDLLKERKEKSGKGFSNSLAGTFQTSSQKKLGKATEDVEEEEEVEESQNNEQDVEEEEAAVEGEEPGV
jgi:hypothetical protein